MLGLKKIIVKINTILVLLIFGLVLIIALSFYLYKTHSTKELYTQEYAAELLAFGLYNEAINVIYQILSSNPPLEVSVKLRRILIELMIDKIGDYEKALSELILLKMQDSTQLASFTEDKIKLCLERLGRSYDVQRRIMLSEGKNPLQNTISSDTIIAFGNQAIISANDVIQRLAQLGLPTENPPKESFDKLLQSMITEEIIKRAAERSGIKRDKSFLRIMKEFEDNLALQMYLEKHILQYVNVDDDMIDLYIKQNKHEFESPIRIIFSHLEFDNQNLALDYISGKYIASQSEIKISKANLTLDQLPTELKSINWSNNPPNFLGPLEKNSKWHVYHIHEIIPAKKIPIELARQQAKLKLLEQKQSGKIAEKITELLQKEDVKIMHENIKNIFFSNDSKLNNSNNNK